jgi:integrase
MSANRGVRFTEGKPQFTRERYQRGSLRKVRKTGGFNWEFRYRVTENGQRKQKQQTFDGAEFPTESAVRLHIEHKLLKLNEGTQDFEPDVRFGAILDRYIAEELPAKLSARQSAQSRVECHIRPKWESVPITQMKPAAIRSWLQELPLAPLTKGHVRSIMHKLFDLAMLWEYIPLERNPIEVVTLRGVTKRASAPILLSPEQAQAIIAKLPKPVDLLTLVIASLGLRFSEALGLQWSDFSVDMDAVKIQRNWYRGAEDTAKTASSEAWLPVAPELTERLKEWQSTQSAELEKLHAEEKIEFSETVWVFCNPWTGKPYSGPSLQQNHLRKAGESLGLGSVGFHDFRHSYRTWLDAAGTPVGVQKSLMRHSAIATTMNVYGGALTAEQRQFNSAVNAKLFETQAATAE